MIYQKIHSNQTTKNQSINLAVEKSPAKKKDNSSESKENNSHNVVSESKDTGSKKKKEKRNHPVTKEPTSSVSNSSVSSSEKNVQSPKQDESIEFLQRSVAKVKDLLKISNNLNNMIRYSNNMDEKEAITQLNNWYSIVSTNKNAVNSLDIIARETNASRNEQIKINRIISQFRIALQNYKEIYAEIIAKLNRNISFSDIFLNSTSISDKMNNSITAIGTANTYTQELATLLGNK
ncbi:hypothetical protein NIE88_12610 [Sporolactobacillus shoreicorticis]|uniref:Uncharacterized protein n=1 Tax=Sporolactobacillus shoreicorticis TaxID=1923877 RepID=A0ABW5S6C9_9BACL|nr:hypothetical protein [Sporolactobacillus shoreicorticis]MCO7126606.1 hypothetical protein [Sporolactobacillus shoreicorticis]